ncbi:hypothetical protein Tco_1353978 [Tanacetum coccineum]
MAKILTSPIFTLNRNKIPNLDPPVGLFVNHLRSLFEFDFGSLDSRLYLRKYTMDKSFGSAKEGDNVRILQSCNEGWSTRSTVWSIGLGEREDDSFLVINFFGKIVNYNLISKTINEIFDIGSNQMDDDDDDVEFISPFSVDPNVYEFIPFLQVCDNPSLSKIC